MIFLLFHQNAPQNSGETVEKGNNDFAKIYHYELPESNGVMVADKTTPYGKL